MVVVLSAKDLTVQYNGTSSPQIQNFNLELDGGVVAIVGPNGAGKSTLLRTLVGIQKVGAGTLEVLGTDLRSAGPKYDLLSRIGFLPQDFGYVPSFTVEEFVMYGAWLKRLPRKHIPIAARDAIEQVSLGSACNTRVGKLSGGMRRRAGIAQAIVHSPDLLILDEPTSGLDPEQRISFRELIRSIQAERCVILSSHLIEDVRALASRVLVLDAGKNLFDGTVPELEGQELPNAPGDSALERGYTSVIAGNRAADQ